MEWLIFNSIGSTFTRGAKPILIQALKMVSYALNCKNHIFIWIIKNITIIIIVIVNMPPQDIIIIITIITFLKHYNQFQEYYVWQFYNY